MKREEATELLKDVMGVCKNISETAILLMPSNADNVQSQGYQLHIKSDSIQENLQCIKPLVEKRNLAIRSETDKGLLVIYRPVEQ